MSTGIISAKKFFEENGLFKLIKLEEGDMKRSYKVPTNKYIIQCENCEEQKSMKGNATWTCLRCYKSVAPTIEDNAVAWVIQEADGRNKLLAKKAMERPAKVLLSPDEVDQEESDDEDIPPATPSVKDTVVFLKDAAKKTSVAKKAPVKKMTEQVLDESDDEPLVVTKKTKAPPKPKETPKEEPECAPIVEEKTMKIVRLKPGQTYYCAVTGVLYLVDA